MRWREFVALVTVLGGDPAMAQEKLYRLGVLSLTSRSLETVRAVAVPEMERLGFAEGRNLVIEMRTGRPDELAAVARELVSRRPDAILAIGTPPIAAARDATPTIPIVIYGTTPVELGFAQELSRPGANIMGIVLLSDELDGKRLELLSEAVSTAKRIAALTAPPRSLQQKAVNDASHREMSERAAKARIELLPIEGTEDYEAAFLSMRAARADGLVIASYPQFRADVSRLAQLAKEAGLPTVCHGGESRARVSVELRPQPHRRVPSHG